MIQIQIQRRGTSSIANDGLTHSQPALHCSIINFIRNINTIGDRYTCKDRDKYKNKQKHKYKYRDKPALHCGIINFIKDINILIVELFKAFYDSLHDVYES